MTPVETTSRLRRCGWAVLVLLFVVVGGCGKREPSSLSSKARADRSHSSDLIQSSRAVYFSPERSPSGELSPDLTLYSHSLAVVIGVDRYLHMRPLRSAERDAKAMAGLLRDRGFGVTLILGRAATRARLATLLGDRLPKLAQLDDRVLVYFAGHGVSEGQGPEAVGYLMPVDGDPVAPIATGLAMTEVVRWFGRYPAKHVMLLADACYSGLALNTRSAGLRPAMERYLEAITSRRMRVVLVGGGAQEQVNEWGGHGLFTHFVLKGLAGEADGNGDGAITSDELVAFVKPEVARVAQRQWGAEQHPQSGRSGEGDFVFLNPKRPGKRGEVGSVTLARVDPAQSDAAQSNAASRQLHKGGFQGPAGVHNSAPQAPVSTGWVRIEGGTAQVGTPTDFVLRDADETPRVVVLSRAFLMQSHELTQAQWSEGRGTNPSEFTGCGGACPVENMTFWDALSFANARSTAEGLPKCYTLRGCARDADGGLRCREARYSGVSCAGFRLPTEDEWEYAARSGSREDTYAGALHIRDRRRAPVLDTIAWHGGHNNASYPGAADCSGWRGRSEDEPGCGTRPVGQLRANRWGLFDMIGNVWEWTWPRAQVGSRGQSGALAVRGFAVCRGGGWYNDARDCRAANRFVLPPHAHYFNVGLRLVRTLP